MPNIFDQTEKLIREFGEIRDHNTAFRELYNSLCNDELLKHYSVFTGNHREVILRELEQIRLSLQTVGEQLTGQKSGSA